MELSPLTIKKLDFIDKCREKFSETNIEKLKLPQIIAVGDQSSGKSSILEAISGIKLPKGEKTVTKRPIVCRMRRSNVYKCTIRCDGREYNDVVDVENKIKEVQGPNVVKDPIFVDVFSLDVPPLTIIDLPGIVKQAIGGQPESIVQNTRQVADEYMKQENSLILCVMPSNVDFNTIDTINLVSKCDKDKSRTIGVLTKIDKLTPEEFKGVSDILKNITKPLSKGYYGLILSDKVLQPSSAGRKEREIEEFKKLGDSTIGCRNNLGLHKFTKKLVEELVSLIDRCLPTLKIIMTDLSEITEKELSTYSESSMPDKRKHLIVVKDEILSIIDCGLVKGVSKLPLSSRCAKFLTDSKVLANKPDEQHVTFHYALSQIYKTLLKKFTIFYKDNFKIPTSKYTVKYLQHLAERCSTEYIQLFIASEPFKEVLNVHLKEYQTQSLDCLETCKMFAEIFIEDLKLKDNVDRYVGLNDSFKKICKDLLNIQFDTTTTRLKIIFESEKFGFTQRDMESTKSDASTESKVTGLVDSTNIPNMGKLVKPLPMSSSMNLGPVSKEKDSDSVSLSGRDDPRFYSGRKLKELLEEYIQNMIHRLGDNIPNFIMLTLFEEFHKQLNETLNNYVTNDDVLKYFELPDGHQQRIDELTKTKNDLESSLKELNDLPNN